MQVINSGSLYERFVEPSFRAECAVFEGVTKEEDFKDPLVLRTRRLELRSVRQADLDLVCKIYQHPVVAKMSGDHLSRDSISHILRKGANCISIGTGNNLVNFGVYTNNKLIGMSQLALSRLGFDCRQQKSAPIGAKWTVVSYHLHPDGWGKGFATEIVRELARYAFEDLGAYGLWGECLESNIGSATVLQKNGLIEAARYIRHNGERLIGFVKTNPDVGLEPEPKRQALWQSRPDIGLLKQDTLPIPVVADKITISQPSNKVDALVKQLNISKSDFYHTSLYPCTHEGVIISFFNGEVRNVSLEGNQIYDLIQALPGKKVIGLDVWGNHFDSYREMSPLFKKGRKTGEEMILEMIKPRQ